MRRISLLLVSLIVLTVQTTLAQTFSVKGTVMSGDDNEPLIGATILQEGTTNGVVTDVDGNYTIEVKDASKATLVISYIGMVTQKHPVNAQTKTLNIITAKPKAHAFKNEMCFPLTKTKCELKKHPNSKFECFFNDFNRTRTSLFLPFPSKLIQDNLVCVLELQE